MESRTSGLTERERLLAAGELADLEIFDDESCEDIDTDITENPEDTPDDIAYAFADGHLVVNEIRLIDLVSEEMQPAISELELALMAGESGLTIESDVPELSTDLIDVKMISTFELTPDGIVSHQEYSYQEKHFDITDDDEDGAATLETAAAIETVKELQPETDSTLDGEVIFFDDDFTESTVSTNSYIELARFEPIATETIEQPNGLVDPLVTNELLQGDEESPSHSPKEINTPLDEPTAIQIESSEPLETYIPAPEKATTLAEIPEDNEPLVQIEVQQSEPETQIRESKPIEVEELVTSSTKVSIPEQIVKTGHSNNEPVIDSTRQVDPAPQSISHLQETFAPNPERVEWIKEDEGKSADGIAKTRVAPLRRPDIDLRPTESSQPDPTPKNSQQLTPDTNLLHQENSDVAQSHQVEYSSRSAEKYTTERESIASPENSIESTDSEHAHEQSREHEYSIEQSIERVSEKQFNEAETAQSTTESTQLKFERDYEQATRVLTEWQDRFGSRVTPTIHTENRPDRQTSTVENYDIYGTGYVASAADEDEHPADSKSTKTKHQLRRSA